MVAVDAVAIVDSGSGLTTMSVGIARKLQASYSAVKLMETMKTPGELKVADGHVREVTQKTLPVRISLSRSLSCPARMMSSFWGNPTLKALGIDVYDNLGARAREQADIKGVNTAAYSYLQRLHGIIRGRWNILRRGLRQGDPPARVEPLKVTLKSDARPVKAKLRVRNPAKSAWLSTCMASLLALGLVDFGMQAVWASAAMGLSKEQPNNFRLVTDFRPVNAQIEQVP